MTLPSPSSERSPRIWMDITTSLRGRGVRPNGTLRVERTLAAGLGAELGASLRFCNYAPLEGRFREADVEAIADAGAAPRSKAPSVVAARRDRLGKRLERAIRLTLRGWLRSARRRFSPGNAATLFPAAQRGDVLLLGGETWSARYDLDVVSRLRREAGLKIVAICQDLIPLTHPQFFQSGEFVARYRAYIDFLLHDTDLLIVYSQSVRASLMDEAKNQRCTPPPISIVPLGSDIAADGPSRAPATQPPLAPGQFVIAVSTIQSRKNFDLLYRVWHRFAEDGRLAMPRLVIVGARGFGSAELLRQIETDALVQDSVMLLHDADDAELAWLYRNCRFTLYPSFAEGWGLPVSESLAYGKPCLASNATSLPEAGAGFARHLDPLDFEAWHDTVLAWSSDDHAIDAMTRDIVSNYKPTSWAQTSAALAGQLRGLIAR